MSPLLRQSLQKKEKRDREKKVARFFPCVEGRRKEKKRLLEGRGDGSALIPSYSRMKEKRKRKKKKKGWEFKRKKRERRKRSKAFFSLSPFLPLILKKRKGTGGEEGRGERHVILSCSRWKGRKGREESVCPLDTGGEKKGEKGERKKRFKGEGNVLRLHRSSPSPPRSAEEEKKRKKKKRLSRGGGGEEESAGFSLLTLSISMCGVGRGRKRGKEKRNQKGKGKGRRKRLARTFFLILSDRVW